MVFDPSKLDTPVDLNTLPLRTFKITIPKLEGDGFQDIVIEGHHLRRDEMGVVSVLRHQGDTLWETHMFAPGGWVRVESYLPTAEETEQYARAAKDAKDAARTRQMLELNPGGRRNQH